MDNLRENLDQFPHISPDLEEMEKMLGQGRELESRINALRGQWREVAAELRTLTAQGERLRARLGAHLKAKYGFTSEALVRYGFRPLAINRRRPAVTKPEVPTPPPAGEEPTGPEPAEV
ncbi:MAG TPA: hypothetical protein VE685_10415 [Thermoanaerobaculia bacterium]|nr:hypothetical protein [Thermoanaerobaculia bacterium]